MCEPANQTAQCCRYPGQGLRAEEGGRWVWESRAQEGKGERAGTGGGSELSFGWAVTLTASQATCLFPSATVALHSGPVWAGHAPTHCGQRAERCEVSQAGRAGLAGPPHLAFCVPGQP